MSQMSMIQAIRSAHDVMMEKDPSVVALGQDIGYFGGVFRCTEGLQEKYGEHRVIDAPIAEGGIIGTAIGMGVNGLRPVAEIQFADYIYPGFDQIVSELSRLRYRSAGDFFAPVTIRTPCGGGIRGGQTHSQSPEALFTHVAGLTTIVPSNPYDAKGLLLQAIADEDPVLFFEPKRVYRAAKMEVPDEPFTIPLGEARVVREGEGLSCVAWGAMLYEALAAAEDVAKQGIDVEVIDLRTLWPLDIDSVVRSVEKTGRFVVVHEAPRTCGFGSELVTLVAERVFLRLEAPPVRVTGYDTVMPLPRLETHYMPSVERVLAGARQVLEFT